MQKAIKAIKILINPHNKRLWLIAILYGALFGFFYQSMVISGTRDRFKEVEETIEITKKQMVMPIDIPVTVIPIDIPVKDTSLLKLKVWLKEHNRPSQVFVNDHLLEKYVSKRKRVAGTTYRIIPADLIKKGENELKIIFPKNVDPQFSMVISYRNYRKSSANNIIFILFDSSKNLPHYLKISEIAIKMLIGVLVLGCIWILGSSGLIKILYLPEKRIYLYGLISFIPSLLIFLIAYLTSIFSPYHIVFSMGYFWTFVIILGFISNICLISRGIWLEYKTSIHLLKVPSLPQFKVPSLPQYLKLNRVFKLTILNQTVIGSIEWVEGRELSDKLILSFMFLLMMCAFWLILEAEPVAEFLANLAYLSLATGVFIKLSKFLKEGKGKGE